MKIWIFRNFPWVAVASLLVGLAAAIHFDVHDKVAVLGGIAAGALSFCYFIQQQRLAETQLFVQLFERFNARYDNLNDGLASIVSAHALTPQQRQLIVDYFNLCAEEYLFFREGYILPSVWQSWCRGMRQYLDREPFSSIWGQEVQSESYYGLTEEIIISGAA
jgi:N-acetylneuraminic acid mutarotase